MGARGVARAAAVAAMILLAAGAAQAVVVDTVPVGNAGNAADTTAWAFGSVGYTYNIGKYEVTAGEYTAFLNAVAATDTYALYNDSMGSNALGCKIQRTGSSGSYTYSVASDYANRPVNYVSFGDATRFANWLHNGQPAGAQDLSTTEDGAYYLNGMTTATQLIAVTRKAGALWALPTENEWYKAAFYDPYKAGGAGYWLYATGSNDTLSNTLSSTGTSNANYHASAYTIGSPYYRTEVGAFAASVSPYGTFDQSGNIAEWTEAIKGTTSRGVRGGAFDSALTWLNSGAWVDRSPTFENYDIGLRVAEVPEPATLGLLALAGLGTLMRRRGVRK